MSSQMIVVMRTGADRTSRSRPSKADRGGGPGDLRHGRRGAHRDRCRGRRRRARRARRASMPGVEQVIRVSKPYKLASREHHPDRTARPRAGRESSAPARPSCVMAGPCAVESREQLLATARWVKREGATILRGGAFKPRTSPYAFQGLGVEGLKLLAEAREETGLPVVSEVTDPADVRGLRATTSTCSRSAPATCTTSCCSRPSARAASRCCSSAASSATIEEWLMAAEYILASGNPNVVLCERGIRTFETATRNTLDLTAVPVLRERTHLPVIVDPSHGTGHRLAGPADGRRRRRGGRRRPHHRGPSRSADGPLRLRAVALVPRVRRPHGRPAPVRVPAPARPRRRTTCPSSHARRARAAARPHRRRRRAHRGARSRSAPSSPSRSSRRATSDDHGHDVEPRARAPRAAPRAPRAAC